MSVPEKTSTLLESTNPMSNHPHVASGEYEMRVSSDKYKCKYNILQFQIICKLFFYHLIVDVSVTQVDMSNRSIGSQRERSIAKFGLLSRAWDTSIKDPP